MQYYAICATKKNYNGGMDLCREKFFRFQENCVRFQATFFVLPK